MVNEQSLIVIAHREITCTAIRIDGAHQDRFHLLVAAIVAASKKIGILTCENCKSYAC